MRKLVRQPVLHIIEPAAGNRVTRCWNEGPYPELLHYDQPPLGKLSNEETTWCVELAKQGSHRDDS